MQSVAVPNRTRQTFLLKGMTERFSYKPGLPLIPWRCNSSERCRICTLWEELDQAKHPDKKGILELTRHLSQTCRVPAAFAPSSSVIATHASLADRGPSDRSQRSLLYDCLASPKSVGGHSRQGQISVLRVYARSFISVVP